MMSKILEMYQKLLEQYGPQGWWPLIEIKGTNPTKTGSITGYHPGDFSYPKNENQRFEICIGAILTQNTSWSNVEKALKNLKRSNALNMKNFKKLSDGKLRELIKPAGYFNQKAKKLKVFADFFSKNKTPTREQLLSLWGIGPETADSILLYAFKETFFVVDAYTKKVFPDYRTMDYEEIRKRFESSLPKDYKVYQEYHALVVEHGKR